MRSKFSKPAAAVSGTSICRAGRYKLTGVDIDKHALEHRKSAEKDLDDAIVADLRSVDLPSNAYDVIYNAYVLEHIDGAEQVLQKFLNWLKPNGALIICIPDRYSAYGFFAYHTPHWFTLSLTATFWEARMPESPALAPTQPSTTRSSRAKEYANSTTS